MPPGARADSSITSASGRRHEQPESADRPRVATRGHREPRAPCCLHHDAQLAQLDHSDGHEVGRADELRDEAVARAPVDLLRLALLDDAPLRRSRRSAWRARAPRPGRGCADRRDADIAMQPATDRAASRARSTASRLESGSSSRSSRGCITSVRASATRCCWPGELRRTARLEAVEAHLGERRLHLPRDLRRPPRRGCAGRRRHSRGRTCAARARSARRPGPRSASPAAPGRRGRHRRRSDPCRARRARPAFAGGWSCPEPAGPSSV